MPTKRILMIAFHYPPVLGSSGMQRTLNFSKYISNAGWQPTVLTAHQRAYARIDESASDPTPPGVTVRRAFATDSSRHFSIGGSYPGFLALPDRWIGWWLGAIPAALRLLRQHEYKAIWSTFPIPTAHLIGLTLHRLSGIPWIADFRDPMTEADYPPDPRLRRTLQWLEAKTVRNADRIVFTTDGSVDDYKTRYPEVNAAKWQTISNGFDESSFEAAEALLDRGKQQPESPPFRLVHSGTLYPSERDPTRFFAALAELKTAGAISAQELRISLRATGYDDLYEPMLRDYGISDIVSLEPLAPYHEALAETLTADGLLIFQASNCNNQIPAKAYESLRARRPILALTDPQGETARLLTTCGINTIAKLDSKDDIKMALVRFIKLLRDDAAPVADRDRINGYSRESQAKKFAALLDSTL